MWSPGKGEVETMVAQAKSTLSSCVLGLRWEEESGNLHVFPRKVGRLRTGREAGPESRAQSGL